MSHDTTATGGNRPVEFHTFFDDTSSTPTTLNVTRDEALTREETRTDFDIITKYGDAPQPTGDGHFPDLTQQAPEYAAILESLPPHWNIVQYGKDTPLTPRYELQQPTKTTHNVEVPDSQHPSVSLVPTDFTNEISHGPFRVKIRDVPIEISNYALTPLSTKDLATHTVETLISKVAQDGIGVIDRQGAPPDLWQTVGKFNTFPFEAALKFGILCALYNVPGEFRLHTIN